MIHQHSCKARKKAIEKGRVSAGQDHVTGELWPARFLESTEPGLPLFRTSQDSTLAAASQVKGDQFAGLRKARLEGLENLKKAVLSADTSKDGKISEEEFMTGGLPQSVAECRCEADDGAKVM